MRRSPLVLALAVLMPVACGKDDAPQTSMEPHNQADVAFVSGMIPHHQQANLMADMATTQAASEEVKALARRIKAGQQSEIEQMQGWLSGWNVAMPVSHGAHAGHRGGSPGHVERGPAGPAPQLSRRSLRQAVPCLHDLPPRGGGDELPGGAQQRNLPRRQEPAGQIIETQQIEIAQMRQLLARLGGPLPTAIPSAPGQPSVPGVQSPLVVSGPTAGQPGSPGVAPTQAVAGRSVPGQPATGPPAAGRPAPGQPATGTPTTQPPVYVPPPPGGGGGGGGGGCTPEHQQQGHC